MADKLETDLHFAIVPRWVSRHPALTAQAVRVYTIIADHAGKDGTAFPARSTIARECGDVDTKTVQRALTLLLYHRALSVEHRDGRSSIYTVHRTPPEGVGTRMSQGQDTDVPTTQDTGVPQKKTQLKNTHEVEKSAPAKRTRDLTFEALADVCGWELDALTKQARGWINGALPELRRLDATPDQIKYHAGNYFLMYGKRPTPSALVKHWPATATPPLRASSRELDRHSERERLHAMQAAAALKETG